jgi:hypothetical protein
MFREKIDCFKCRHFYITWDKSFPKGCEAIGFKSEKMPSAVVYEASGTACLRFAKKELSAERLKL